jgi:hypothetical protein
MPPATGFHPSCAVRRVADRITWQAIVHTLVFIKVPVRGKVEGFIKNDLDFQEPGSGQASA